ncbi:MAG: hypothetical protein JF591_02795 [Lysobacter sp.]|nr:hypothetical protein [Lysobacter sp.]
MDEAIPDSNRPTRSASAHRFARLSIAASTAYPMLAAATTQCPPGSSDKNALFWTVGFSVLGLFVLLGLAAPFAAIRFTRVRGTAVRVLWTLAACVPMLGVWLLGLMVFGNVFIMSC